MEKKFPEKVTLEKPLRSGETVFTQGDVSLLDDEKPLFTYGIPTVFIQRDKGRGEYSLTHDFGTLVREGPLRTLNYQLVKIH